MEMKIILTEKKGESGRQLQYVKTVEGKRIVQIEDLEGNNQTSSSIKELLSSIFLPQGYPNSVSEDYLPYQIWDTIQAFASSLSGSLATRAVLEGVGVGSSTSTPLAATLMWLIKDGTGMVGRILFAWLNGTNLDADSKKWRFFADVLNDLAMTLELCAPYALALIGGSTKAMTGILCLAGTAKSIVGVAGGATRAALTQHQARQGNLADVAAKDGSQETLVNLAALITSLWLLPFLDGSTRLTWMFFCIFTALHIFANFRAVKSVQMRTLNRTRFLIILKEYLFSGKLLTVEETNRLEPVVFGFIPSEKDVCAYEIRLGESLKDIAVNIPKFDEIISKSSDCKFSIIPNDPDRILHVILREDCVPEEVLEAYAKAFFYASKTSGKKIPVAIEMDWSKFRNGLLSLGWNLNVCALLTPGEWRASW